jgi:hypothetical protein
LLGRLVQWEARLRQWWAVRRQDRSTVKLFGQLRDIATDLGSGHLGAAKRRLRGIVRREEHRCAA